MLSAMTTSLFVIGTPAACVGHAARITDGVPSDHGVDVAHAVARPAVDGLESSVGGLLVTAVAARDWRSARHAPRCDECSRIAG